MNRLAVVIFLSGALLLLSSSCYAQAKTMTIAGYNNNTIQSVIDNQNRIFSSARLHNATLDKQLGLVAANALK